MRRLSIYEEDDLAYAGKIELYGAGKSGESILSFERDLGVFNEKPWRKVDVQGPAVNEGGEHGAAAWEDPKRIMTRRSQEHPFRELRHVLFQHAVTWEQAFFRDHSPTGLGRKEKHAHHLPVPFQDKKKKGEHKDPQEDRAEDQGPAAHAYAENEIQPIEHLYSRFVRIVL